jgi:hypothetical protein
MADGREVAILGFEMARRRSKMFVAGGELATPFERRREARVRALVELGKFDPIFEALQNFVGFRRKTARQALQHGDMEGPEAAPLRRQPALELRAAVNLHNGYVCRACSSRFAVVRLIWLLLGASG